MKKSAGLLLYRRVNSGLEVLLVHPGGPFWAKKDSGAWSIPKGEYSESEEPLAAAKREFVEELGLDVPEIEWEELGAVKYSGKEVVAWAGESDLDLTGFKSGTFEMEWPPKSGRKTEFVEVDRVEWFGLDEAKEKIVAGQREFLDRLTDFVTEEN